MLAKSIRNKAFAALLAALAAPAPASAASMSANNFQIPSKDVTLLCTPLRYRVNCSISMRANPQYSSFCFYVAQGRSYPMKTDYRFGFYNDIVDIQVDDGMRISAELTERSTGRRAHCAQVGIAR